jgi:hypothetical protein
LRLLRHPRVFSVHSTYLLGDEKARQDRLAKMAAAEFAATGAIFAKQGVGVGKAA